VTLRPSAERSNSEESLRNLSLCHGAAPALSLSNGSPVSDHNITPQHSRFDELKALSPTEGRGGTAPRVRTAFGRIRSVSLRAGCSNSEGFRERAAPFVLGEFFWTNDSRTSLIPHLPPMKKLTLRAVVSAIACHTITFYFCGAFLPMVAFGHGRSPNDNVPRGTLVDRLGNVLVRPSASLGEDLHGEAVTGPTTFAFVPGHYYTSNYFSRVITEYDGTGAVVGSYTLPSDQGEEVRGLAFGADGLLYATVSRGSSGSAVLALRSDGSVAVSYTWPVNVTGSNVTYGKIAMDNQYLYLCGAGGLTRFLLGDSSSGTSIYTWNSIYDVKPLPNGHLFVVFSGNVDEITTSGALVRHVTSYPFSVLVDAHGIEYNPATNILFVTHLGRTDFFDRIMRFNATTGALLSDTTFSYPIDLFLDASGNLLVGSDTQNPAFFSQDLVQGNSLQGGQQMFVTQYAPAQALNISTRMRVESGNNVLIGGFIITGTAPKNVAVRGIGPSLGQFGIPDFLADPTLELRDSSGGLVRQNDNWQDDPSQAFQLTTLGLALQNPNESGMVASLSPAAYTAILAGKNGGTGVGLVEVYDTNSGADSQLANISTRGFVLADTNVMIGGFILGGANNTHVVVRGIGPSLAEFGLSPVLDDPTLELRDSNGALLVANDNWQDDPVSAAQLTARGLAPTNATESGIQVSQFPGAFTAILAGKNGGTGIGLVEIYNVH
jgi:hypothetical protein